MTPTQIADTSLTTLTLLFYDIIPFELRMNEVYHTPKFSLANNMLTVFGINHHKTPIAIRERMAFDTNELPLALNQLIETNINSEAVILSTCSRTEIYTTLKNSDHLQQWLIQQKSLRDIELNKISYCYQDQQAIMHLMRVASGLDSAVLGEPQILGQMKQAYLLAQNANTTGTFFNQLFPAIFNTAKYIRSETNIGAHSASIPYTITQLSQRIFPTLNHCAVLLVGAGEIIELLATYLHGLNVAKIIIANRTLEKSQCIAASVQAKTIRIHDIPGVLNETDIVIAATASQLPMIGKGMIERIIKHRDGKPLLLFDLAVPRDIEPEVAELSGVHLYNIDDLQTILSQNKQNRLDAAKTAENIVAAHSALFLEKMRVFNARDIITRYRERLEKIRIDEQEKAMRQLQQGSDPKKVLEQFGSALVNKIMHHPTMKLREAAAMEECSALRNMKEFFEL